MRLRTSSSRSRARSTWIATRASFSSARCRRALNRPRPAASSISARRSSGFDAKIASTFPCPMIECRPWPRPRGGEQLDEVEPAHGRTVEQVLALATPVEAARDRELGVVERPGAVLVVEEQLDLAEVGRAAAGGTCEEDVVRLLGPQLVRAERARRPANRVGDVRLARSVRPNDHADARLEAYLDRVREGLEATELDRAKVHPAGTLASPTDAASARRVKGPCELPSCKRSSMRTRT